MFHPTRMTLRGSGRAHPPRRTRRCGVGRPPREVSTPTRCARPFPVAPIRRGADCHAPCAHSGQRFSNATRSSCVYRFVTPLGTANPYRVKKSYQKMAMRHCPSNMNCTSEATSERKRDDDGQDQQHGDELGPYFPLFKIRIFSVV